MAENLAGLGIEVTLLELADQLLPPLDPEMAGYATERLQANGVHVRLGEAVESFEQLPDNFLRFHDLRLVRERTPILALSWTVMHVIDESSPFYGHTAETLNDCMVVVSFSGLNETMLQGIQAHKAYSATDIRWGKSSLTFYRPHLTASG